jgi:uncharacterized protein (TIGR03435 family)
MPRQIWKHASRGAGIGFACLALLLATASFLCAQQKPAANPAQPADSAQPAQRDYRFEVASVRLAGPPTGHEYLASSEGYSPGRFRETNTSFGRLAFEAFRPKYSFGMKYQSWMGSVYFTINATLPEGATKADLPIMIQHLLEDRFGLVFHHETRQMAGYELVVAKPGPHLARSAGPAPDPSMVKGSGIVVKNGVPQPTKDAPSGQLFFGTTAILHGRNQTMKGLASDIAEKLGAPVIDATALEGEYDYTFTYSNEPPSASEVGQDVASVDAMLNALQEQLGLKLKSVKNVPVDVVVLDSANKVPTEN